MKKQRHYITFGIPLLLMMTLAYLIYHFVSGNSGVVAWSQLHHKREMLAQESKLIAQQKHKLEHQVNQLYTDSVDKDLLDEKVRYMLGLVGKNEIIYFDEKQ